MKKDFKPAPINATVELGYRALMLTLANKQYKSSMAYGPTPPRPHRPRRKVIQNWIYGSKYGQFRRKMFRAVRTEDILHDARKAVIKSRTFYDAAADAYAVPVL